MKTQNLVNGNEAKLPSEFDPAPTRPFQDQWVLGSIRTDNLCRPADSISYVLIEGGTDGTKRDRSN